VGEFRKGGKRTSGKKAIESSIRVHTERKGGNVNRKSSLKKIHREKRLPPEREKNLCVEGNGSITMKKIVLVGGKFKGAGGGVGSGEQFAFRGSRVTSLKSGVTEAQSSLKLRKAVAMGKRKRNWS